MKLKKLSLIAVLLFSSLQIASAVVPAEGKVAKSYVDAVCKFIQLGSHAHFSWLNFNSSGSEKDPNNSFYKKLGNLSQVGASLTAPFISKALCNKLFGEKISDSSLAVSDIAPILALPPIATTRLEEPALKVLRKLAEAGKGVASTMKGKVASIAGRGIKLAKSFVPGKMPVKLASTPRVNPVRSIKELAKVTKPELKATSAQSKNARVEKVEAKPVRAVSKDVKVQAPKADMTLKVKPKPVKANRTKAVVGSNTKNVRKEITTNVKSTPKPARSGTYAKNFFNGVLKFSEKLNSNMFGRFFAKVASSAAQFGVQVAVEGAVNSLSNTISGSRNSAVVNSVKKGGSTTVRAPRSAIKSQGLTGRSTPWSGASKRSASRFFTTSNMMKGLQTVLRRMPK